MNRGYTDITVLDIAEAAAAFSLAGAGDDLHDTPSGGPQHFVYAVLRRR
jgi:hypothetical protein